MPTPKTAPEFVAMPPEFVALARSGWSDELLRGDGFVLARIGSRLGLFTLVEIQDGDEIFVDDRDIAWVPYCYVDLYNVVDARNAVAQLLAQSERAMRTEETEEYDEYA